MLIEKLSSLNEKKDPGYMTFMYAHITSDIDAQMGVHFKYTNTRGREESYGGKIVARVEEDENDENTIYKRMSTEKFEELRSQRKEALIESLREKYAKEYQRKINQNRQLEL